MLVRCGLAIAACAAVLAPSASAGWLPNQPLSAPDRQAVWPAIALAPDGRMLATWARSDGTNTRIEVTARAPGGQFEQPQILSDAGQNTTTPQVALDAQGNAFLMWIRAGDFQWATRPAGAAAFGAVHPVDLPAGENASAFALRMSAAGEPAALVLTNAAEGVSPDIYPHFRVRALTRATSGLLQAGGVLDEGTNDADDLFSFGPVDLDVDAAGTFYATWTRFMAHMAAPASSASAVKAAVRPPGAGTAFGAPEDVATATGNSGDPAPDVRVGPASSGVDAGGTFRVAYVRLIESPPPAQSELLLRSRPPGGGSAPGSGFDPGTETVVPLQENGAFNVAFDVNAGGTSLAVWTRGGSTVNRIIEACVRPPAGPCGTTQPLASGEVLVPVGAIGSTGDAVAAWRRGSGLNSAADASFARAGTFGPAHELGTGAFVQVTAEATAVDGMGHAVVAIERLTPGPVRTIEAIVNDSVAPSIANLGVPTLGEPGDSLAFAPAVSDVWSPFTAEWQFGDGSSAPGPSATHAYSRTGTFTATLTATDAEGNTATQSAPVQVRRIPPRILSFGMSHRLFAVGAKPTALSGARRVPVGTTFRFRLSEAATARIAIQRKRGRKWKTVGTLKRRASTKPKRVAFSGRLRRKALKRARYRAVLVATDRAKNRSKPRRLGFKVVRRQAGRR